MTHERIRRQRVWVGYGVEAIRTVSKGIVGAACLARMPSWFAPAMRQAWRRDAKKREMQQATTGNVKGGSPEGGDDLQSD